jgi:hypothetical protein
MGKAYLPAVGDENVYPIRPFSMLIYRNSAILSWIGIPSRENVSNALPFRDYWGVESRQVWANREKPHRISAARVR